MAKSFADVMKEARNVASGTPITAQDPAPAVAAAAPAPVIPAAAAPVAPVTPAPAVDEVAELRRQLAEATRQADERIAAREAELAARAAQDTAASDALRQEFAAAQARLKTFEDAAHNTELDTFVDGLTGDEDLDTAQVQSIARKMLPLLKKVEERNNTRKDDSQIKALQAELEAMKEHQASMTKMTVQDRVMARAKQLGVDAEAMLDNDHYKRLLKDRIPGSRQTHGQALFEMLSAGDVEDAASKLKELSGLMKPDYAAAAVTPKAAAHGNYVGDRVPSTPEQKDFNGVADDLMRRLRQGEISRTEHSKQVRDNFKSLFAGGR